jgi:hypothetical protein|tara:strand:+ start:13159 stop:13305 length:147 start_codon:yes stop_codon:yes gene_type:complete
MFQPVRQVLWCVAALLTLLATSHYVGDQVLPKHRALRLQTANIENDPF